MVIMNSLGNITCWPIFDVRHPVFFGSPFLKITNRGE